MIKTIHSGVYPTMIIPYTQEGSIDYNATEKLIEWYIENGVHGIFTLCQSTEIFFLSLAEREAFGRFVLDHVAGRADVIVSGHISENLNDQIEELKVMCSLGADAVCLIRNRADCLPGMDFRRSIDQIMAALPDDMPLGMYECPYPYKKYLTEDAFKYLSASGRFAFLKDTVCDTAVMRQRVEWNRGSAFKLFNANAATFFESLRFGYDGFSGVMANFHPDLYVWLYEHQSDPKASIIDKYIGMMSVIEARSYPICAKRYLAAYEGIPMTDVTRSVKDATVPALSSELCDLNALTFIARELIKEEA